MRGRRGKRERAGKDKEKTIKGKRWEFNHSPHQEERLGPTPEADALPPSSEYYYKDYWILHRHVERGRSAIYYSKK